MTKTPQETSWEHLARIEIKTADLINLIQGSDWKEDQATIELTQMGKKYLPWPSSRLD